tara:strand:- start:1894 stop:3261 length:1368 start_codon:yes stop_codon:yes gene_type:complete
LDSFNQVIISVTPFAFFAALVDKRGEARAFFVELDGHISEIGDIRLGKFTRPVTGHGAFFVSVGKKSEAILKGSYRPGGKVIVQITRDRDAFKGPMVTSEPVYLGRHLVYLPHGQKDTISRRLNNTEEYDRLLSVLSNIKRPHGSFIARRYSSEVSSESIMLEAAKLLNRSKLVKDSLHSLSESQYLESANGLLGRIIREFALGDTSLYVDDRKVYAIVRKEIEEYDPEYISHIKLEESEDLFERYDLYSQLSDSLNSEVRLPSGGRIIIEETAACVTIDVDSGTASGLRSREIACREAITVSAQEIIKRNLAGLIAIDLPLESGKKRSKEYVNSMKFSLSGDIVSSDVLGVTHGGVLEVTRRRVGKSLMGSMTELNRDFQWPVRRFRLKIIEHYIAAQLKRETRSGSSIFTISISPDLKELVNDKEKFSEWLSANVTIQIDPLLKNDEYRIDQK